MPRALPSSLWLLVAIIPMVASQIIRLQQVDPAVWLLWDYAGRVCGLAVLALIPSARAVAFRRQRLQMALWQVVLATVGIVLIDRYLGGWIRETLNGAFPRTVLGDYPLLQGPLRFIDLTFGLALVAFSEEIVFRRYAGYVFDNRVRNAPALVFVTSVLFGAYHWWTGIGNIFETIMVGALLMVFLRRSGALWPVVVAHYLTDVVDFL